MIKESSKVAPFLALFLVHGGQVGVGILGFQRIIMKSAGYDSWITVILTGLFVSILLWLMYTVLKHTEDDQDIFDLNRKIFGKWIGSILNLVAVLYFFLSGLVVLRTFIEIIQVWMFPKMTIWPLVLVFVILIYYIIAGGFRTVAGIAFLGVLLPLPLLFVLLFPLKFAHFANLLPIVRIPVQEIVLSTKDMTISYLGFELLLVYYPFLREKEKTQKWAQYGVLMTTIIYTLVMIVSLSFYSEGQLSRSIWATLSLFKVVQMPFVERFEYIGISMWTIVMLPNITLTLWAASRMVKKQFEMTQQKALILLLALLFILTLFVSTRQQIDLLNSLFSISGMSLLGIYVPVLAVISYIRRKRE